MAQTVFAPWDDPQAKPLIQFRNVTKRFGEFTAIENLTQDIYEREFFSLLGPSGCGKTTLMRMLAGFENVTEGQILIAGQDMANVPPNKRAVNMMFQSYALFPHLSVWENIAFGLKREGKPLPPGAAVDKNGKETLDPNEVAALLPFGAHKGYGMALINELVGGFIGGNLPTERGRSGAKTTSCFYFQVIHPDAWNSGAYVHGSQSANMKAVLDDVLGHGNENCLLPGQIEAHHLQAELVARDDGGAGELQ